ncbi:MAG: methyltransferase domain-containing protein [Pseudomonadota bacterium]
MLGVSAPEGLAYVEPLIEAYRAGWVGDHVHLGFYDASGPAAEGMAGLGRAQEAMALLHLERVGLRDGLRLVDVGCGLGGTLRLVNDRVSGAELTGVNIDPRQLAVAGEIAERNGNRLSWRLGDASDLPPLELRCEAAVSLEAMFHFPDADGFLRGAWTMLAPGGLMAVSTILLGSNADLPPLLTAARTRVVEGFAPWPEPAMTLPGLIARAGAAGFEVLDVADLTEAVGPTFDVIAPDVRAETSGSATVEMARLHRAGALRYVMLTLRAGSVQGDAQGGGNTQK